LKSSSNNVSNRIGAPNAESVFIYKTYTAVKIFPELTPSKSSILYKDTEFSIKVCSFFTANKKMKTIKIVRTIRLDNRVSFSTNGTDRVAKNEVISYNTTAPESCTNHTIHINKNRINSQDKKAIKIVVETVPLNKINETSGEFCKNCVLMEPDHPKKKDFEIPLNTGCKDGICKPDLVVKGEFLNQPGSYTIGSSEKIAMDFQILNRGDDSYEPKISVKIISDNAKFIPSSACKIQLQNIMECKLTNGYPLETNQTIKQKIEIDTRSLSGTELEIQAVVSSSGIEKNPADNAVTKKLKLLEFSAIDIVGNSTKVQAKEKLDLYSLSFEWQIRNSGPSPVNKLLIDVFIPTKVKNKPLEVSRIVSLSREYGNSYDDLSEEETQTTRTRRFDNDVPVSKNPKSKSKSILDDVESSKLISLECSKNAKNCIKKQLKVEDFVKGDELIYVKLNVEIDMKKLGRNAILSSKTDHRTSLFNFSKNQG
jgi:hypothetical protein